MSLSAESKKYLNPKAVATLKDYRLLARMIVEGYLIGQHRGPKQAFSLEYSQHRDYYPGDPLKRVDWKLYGKTDRFYIKQYEEETNLEAWMVLDMSGSMSYRGKKTEVTKLQYASYLAAALTQMLIDQHDLVGMAFFDDQIRKVLKPSSSTRQLNLILSQLQNLKGGGESGFEEAAKLAASHIKRRGLVMLFSDLLMRPENFEKTLKYYLHRGSEVIVFHVLSEEELGFPFKRFGCFEDLETHQKIMLQPKMIQDEYVNQMKQYLETIRKTCEKMKVVYQLIETSMPFDQALKTFVKTRTKMH